MAQLQLDDLGARQRPFVLHPHSLSHTGFFYFFPSLGHEGFIESRSIRRRFCSTAVAYDGEESGPQLVSKITARLGCARTASLLQYFGVRSWPEVIKEATECGDEDALFLG